MVNAFEFITVAKRWGLGLFECDPLCFEFSNRSFRVIGARINHKKMTVKLIYDSDFKHASNENDCEIKTFSEFQEAIHQAKAHEYTLIGQFDEMFKIFEQYKQLVDDRHAWYLKHKKN